jgi:hypothetical protein
MSYSISVILPTRGRFELCCKSLDSLFNNAEDPHKIEVMIGYDNDDINIANQIKHYYRGRENIRFYEYPRYGYKYLNKYVNDLSLKANGKWLFLWNDDAIMESYGWDNVINAYNRFCCICPRTNTGHFGLFPIIPKKWVEITGHFSLNCSNDSWVEEISQDLNINIKEYNIYITHDRGDVTGNNRDTTFYEREYDNTYGSEEQKQLRKNDATKIVEYLKNNQ